MLTLNDSLILFDGSTRDLTCQPAQNTDVWIGSVFCNFLDIKDKFFKIEILLCVIQCLYSSAAVAVLGGVQFCGKEKNN